MSERGAFNPWFWVGCIVLAILILIFIVPLFHRST